MEIPRERLDVLAIGNALVDVLARVDDDLVVALGLHKGSMSLVDAAESERIYGSVVPETHMSGGSAANTAVGLASLGGSAGFIGRVADDSLGKEFARDITRAGVEFVHRPAGEGGGTGHCTILVTPDAERTMATHLGVAAQLDIDDIVPSMVDNARVTYVEGYLWDLDDARTALRHAMDRATGAGNLVALSLSDPFCVQRHGAEFRDLIGGPVDIVFGNEEEVCLLWGAESFDDAVASFAGTGALGALTRGAGGSSVVCGPVRADIPARTIGAVLDTTGAGDLYAAGFLAGLVSGNPERGAAIIDGADLRTCAHLGSLCAAEVISHMGSRPQVRLGDLAAQHGLA